MDNTNKATKCIAVKTPFGLMYLSQDSEYGAYVVSEESKVVYRKYLSLTEVVGGIDFVPYDDQFIVGITTTAKFAGLLSITSNYGDQFPNG